MVVSPLNNCEVGLIDKTNMTRKKQYNKVGEAKFVMLKKKSGLGE